MQMSLYIICHYLMLTHEIILHTFPAHCTFPIITLSHCEIWSHFTHGLYLHSPLAHENTDTTREITRHISC